MDNQWQAIAMQLLVGGDLDNWVKSNEVVFTELAAQWRQFAEGRSVIGVTPNADLPSACQANGGGVVWWNDENHSTHITPIGEVWGSTR
jgi:hypothetical protein